MQAVVKRIEELYDAIYELMEREPSDNAVAKDILGRMKKQSNLLNLHFLRFILPLINNMNRMRDNVKN